MHNHLTITERIAPAALRKAGLPAVYRELRRNGSGRAGYRPKAADRKAKERRKESKEHLRKIAGDLDLQRRIEEPLHPPVSPETVAHLIGVHHRRIYDWIMRDRPDLKEKLPRKGKRKTGVRKGKEAPWISRTKSIHDRPETKEPSWEGGGIVGPTGARILTYAERRSLFPVAVPVPDGNADTVHRVMREHPLPGQITYDCGGEFALAAGEEREHQRTAQENLPEGNRLIPDHAGGTGPGRAPHESHPEEVPGVENARRGVHGAVYWDCRISAENLTT